MKEWGIVGFKSEYNVVGFIYLLFIFKFGESGENWGKVYLAFIKKKNFFDILLSNKYN